MYPEYYSFCPRCGQKLDEQKHCISCGDGIKPLRLEFTEGFAWTVPIAFLDPVAECRFEEGDILYDNREDYQKIWRADVKPINYQLQVMFPPRSATKITPETVIEQADKTLKRVDNFQLNWHSRLECILTEYPSHQQRRIITTQGHLYTMLWKGDIHLLDQTQPPSMPLRANKLKSCLHQAQDYYLHESLGGPETFFIMPYDRTLPLLRDKFLQVESALRKFAVTVRLDSPETVGIHPSQGEFAPTVCIACFCIPKNDLGEIELLLKTVLYKPSPGAKKDMFRITSHGMLFSSLAVEHELTLPILD